MTRAEKAQAWAAQHMVAGQFVDSCPYVRSGYGVWNQRTVLDPSYCTCREVPKSYAALLGAPSNADTQKLHEDAF